MLTTITNHLPGRRATFIIAVLTALAVLLIVGFHDALAAATPAAGDTQAAQGAPDKIKEILGSWGKGILVAVAGLVAIPMLAKRDVGGVVVVLIMVLLVGGLFFAPGVYEKIIGGLWTTIGGGN